jgi:acetamidase/formamidase
MRNTPLATHFRARVFRTRVFPIVSEYGYDRTQAYMIASVAVDMRIGQLVDVPNVGVTAILPLDIFVGHD